MTRLDKEDALAFHWVCTKASPTDIVTDIVEATGVVVDDRLDDLLEPLTTDQLDQVVSHLQVQL